MKIATFQNLQNPSFLFYNSIWNWTEPKFYRFLENLVNFVNEHKFDNWQLWMLPVAIWYETRIFG